MLVLSRNVSEEIIITAPNGDRITLMLVSVRNAGGNNTKKARIGIDAPKTYRVHRKEVHEAIERGDGYEREAEK